ncbi:amidohydrolase/deacetylase family metallohydrolase [Acidilutibacter cellobiosedens]|jgi:dihydroorotase|uniref:Amidohydrolase/deacetylase family metallohydrolase n=1 Tax=Acidilutibacter cellobiosedens TaxID=2507161 RepID=A0A410Q997_9FIRM|nr:amidohydrolase/deacetylase family metallohydrolase [Tissierellaceae bacterium]QAT60454.1 amidohydrolase/deacetylase family metallohydrolase [Acidilutibacter cellobiosedens]
MKLFPLLNILNRGGKKLDYKQVLIKGAKLLDLSEKYRYVKKDVLIKNGIINSIEDDIPYLSNMKLIDGKGYNLSPGFIDIHTHVYPEKTSLGIKADTVGVYNGVTSLFDAGSQGPVNFDDFRQNVILKNITDVYAFLNIAKTGLEKERYEIADLSNIDLDMVKDVYYKNKDFIKGIKVRASASCVGELGIKPVELAKKVSKELGIPLLVHIGNRPPDIDDVLNLLEKGDIVTHTFHGKPKGILENDKIRPSFLRARDRGVLFDVGHGTSSFNFNVFRKAFDEKFYPDLISTDIYKDNYNGPVFSLEQTINKLIGMGMTIEDCIYKVTYVPARHLGLDKVGSLKVGFKADLTLFRIEQKERTYVDSEKNLLKTSKGIDIDYVLKNGVLIESGKN